MISLVKCLFNRLQTSGNAAGAMLPHSGGAAVQNSLGHSNASARNVALVRLLDGSHGRILDWKTKLRDWLGFSNTPAPPPSELCSLRTVAQVQAIVQTPTRRGYLMKRVRTQITPLSTHVTRCGTAFPCSPQKYTGSSC